MRGFLEYARLTDRTLLLATLVLLPIAWLLNRRGDRGGRRAEHEFVYTVF